MEYGPACPRPVPVVGARSRSFPRAGPRPHDEIDRLRDGIRTFHRVIAANPDLASILREEARSGSDRMRYLYDRHLRPIIETLRPRLERLVAEGRERLFQVDVILFCAIAMTQATNSAPLLRLIGDTVDTDPDSILPLLSESCSTASSHLSPTDELTCSRNAPGCDPLG